MGLACAVHGLDALWDDDNERRPYEHTGAEECDDTQLSRRKGEGEGKDAGDERTSFVNRYSAYIDCSVERDSYAIAIIVLKVSSMKRPSHMLSVVCGCPQELLKKEDYA